MCYYPALLGCLHLWLYYVECVARRGHCLVLAQVSFEDERQKNHRPAIIDKRGYSDDVHLIAMRPSHYLALQGMRSTLAGNSSTSSTSAVNHRRKCMSSRLRRYGTSQWRNWFQDRFFGFWFETTPTSYLTLRLKPSPKTHGFTSNSHQKPTIFTDFRCQFSQFA
jgi:hypothetical protein